MLKKQIEYYLYVGHFLSYFQKKRYSKKIIEEISKTKNYEEFAEYFNAQWGKYFKKNNLLDYSCVSPSYRTNNLLENYNGRIKKI